MSIFKNFDWSAKSIAKVVGVIFIGIVGLSVAISLVGFSFRTIAGIGGSKYDQDRYGYDAMEESAFNGMPKMMSSKSMSMPDYNAGYSNGTDAEDYEVKHYSGTINTRKLDKTCGVIADLKILEYVIFEDSNKNDDSCYYRFKVKNEKTEEIVSIIESLNPETLNANVQSIKANVEGIDDELSILKKKLKSIEETLNNAENAYDEISKLATRKQDAETLAKVIDSKLNLIERLSNQKLQVSEQIDRYSERRGDQLDQLDYSFFNINVYKDLIFDWKQIKDNWKYETKELVRNINEVLQEITLNLVTYLARFAQAILYLFISIFLIKFAWIGIKRIWTGSFKGKKGRK